MKTIEILFLISLSVLACSCGKGDEKMDLITSLKQTSWKGTYEAGDAENKTKATVLLEFYTDKEGHCNFMYENGNAYQDYFKYTADGKLLVINGSIVEGNWLLASKTNKLMVLENGTGSSPSAKIRMVLEKEN